MSEAPLLVCKGLPAHCLLCDVRGEPRVSSSSYKGKSPVGLGPHPYDLIYPLLVPHKSDLQIQSQ